MTPEPKSRAPIQFKSAQLEAKLVLRAENNETAGSVAKAYLEQYLLLLESVTFPQFSTDEIRFVQFTLSYERFYFPNARRIWAIVDEAIRKGGTAGKVEGYDIVPDAFIDKLKALSLLECLALWDLGRQTAVELEEWCEDANKGES
ncbi:MAG: hypothetical protein K2W95_15465 [Candidatus Obscuribacterales bacterium]|nr:hypothetical protein [Candidatus Obscuribacterales bacterium]